MEGRRLYPAVAADDWHGSVHPGPRRCDVEEAWTGLTLIRMTKGIGRLWGRLGRRQQPAWPRMEQSEYRSYRAVHPFDERFGVDTSGLIYELASGHRHDAYNNGYFAVAPSVFHAVMQAMRERLHLDFER